MTPTATIPGEVLSPSQASLFLSCGARYWYRYGQGQPDAPAGESVRGTAVHTVVIDYALRAKMEGVIVDAPAIADAWDAAFDQAADGAEFDAADNIEALKASGLALAQRYVAEVVPTIEPAALEVPVSGAIAGVPVRGFVDIVTTDGTIIDLKTAKRNPGKVDARHAFQLATYTALTPNANGQTRLDRLVATKSPQLIQIDHTPGEAGQRLIETMYPLIVEGIAGGLFLPNRNSTVCSRKYCPFADKCVAEFGGNVE